MAGRRLDARHQLQESRHATKGQRPCRHAYGSPGEGHQVAEREAQVEDEIGQDGELRAAHDILPQLALLPLQPIDRMVGVFERLDERLVLDGLLQHTLDDRVALAHLACQSAHPPHVDLAEEGEERNGQNDDDRQTPVHLQQVEERATEEQHLAERVGDGLGQKRDHLRHVRLQAVEHVARMAPRLAAPGGSQDAVEHLLLHAVLCADAQ